MYLADLFSGRHVTIDTYSNVKITKTVLNAIGQTYPERKVGPEPGTWNERQVYGFLEFIWFDL